MKKEWKQELKRIYEAPAPKEKWEFLESLKAPELTYCQFLWQQAGHLRKSSWLLAVSLFLAALYIGRRADLRLLWVISACVPYLALNTVAESSRSIRYGMDELELSTRFSLKMVLLARLGVLGLGNLFLLCCMIGILHGNLLFPAGKELLFLGSGMLLPYLLTAFLNLWAVQRFREREGLYLCLAFTCGVSVLYTVMGSLKPAFYETWQAGSCIGAVVLLAVLTGREGKKWIRQSEEYRWNSL